MKKETKTVLINGHELDAETAGHLFAVIRDSVPRVVEALVIAGKTDQQVKAAAKTTAEAVVDSMVDLFRSKAKAAAPEE